MGFQKQIKGFKPRQFLYTVCRDRHDSDLKNSRFTEITKHNEEYLDYLDVLDINVLLSQKKICKLKLKFLQCRCRC